MKIRLEGTLRECADAVEELRRGFHVKTVSRPYKNRNSDLHRVYVEAEQYATEWGGTKLTLD